LRAAIAGLGAPSLSLRSLGDKLTGGLKPTTQRFDE
jgi:hypothetical protein